MKTRVKKEPQKKTIREFYQVKPNKESLMLINEVLQGYWDRGYPNSVFDDYRPDTWPTSNKRINFSAFPPLRKLFSSLSKGLGLKNKKDTPWLLSN